MLPPSWPRPAWPARSPANHRPRGSRSLRAFAAVRYRTLEPLYLPAARALIGTGPRRAGSPWCTSRRARKGSMPITCRPVRDLNRRRGPRQPGGLRATWLSTPAPSLVIRGRRPHVRAAGSSTSPLIAYKPGTSCRRRQLLHPRDLTMSAILRVDAVLIRALRGPGPACTRPAVRTGPPVSRRSAISFVAPGCPRGRRRQRGPHLAVGVTTRATLSAVTAAAVLSPCELAGQAGLAQP